MTLKILTKRYLTTKSAGAVEYADCISTEGYDPLNECPGYETKLHLMMRLQFWSFGGWGVLLHCHNSQVHSDPEW